MLFIEHVLMPVGAGYDFWHCSGHSGALAAPGPAGVTWIFAEPRTANILALLVLGGRTAPVRAPACGQLHALTHHHREPRVGTALDRAAAVARCRRRAARRLYDADQADPRQS